MNRATDLRRINYSAVSCFRLISDDDSPEKKAVGIDKNGDTPENAFEIKDFLQKREEKSGLVEKRNEESKTFVNKDIFEKKESKDIFETKESKDSDAENEVSEDDDDGRCSPVISSCHVSFWPIWYFITVRIWNLVMSCKFLANLVSTTVRI